MKLQPGEELVGARLSVLEYDPLWRVTSNYVDLEPGEFAIAPRGGRYGSMTQPYRYQVGASNPATAVVIVRRSAYVQVNFMEYSSSSYRYTYRDPSASLQVGDVVEVPTTSQGLPRVAKVVALGRGSWDGEVKDVTARLERTVLAA